VHEEKTKALDSAIDYHPRTTRISARLCRNTPNEIAQGLGYIKCTRTMRINPRCECEAQVPHAG
jgi:hypothetical protein